MIRIKALLRNCFHGQTSCRRSAGVNQKQPICKYGRRKRWSKNELVLMGERYTWHLYFVLFLYYHYIILALYRDEKTAVSMKDGVDILESILGAELFHKYVHVLLTDRGTEFSAAEAMEASHDGTRRTRVFYCDPMQSGQKGTLENKHIELRYIHCVPSFSFFNSFIRAGHIAIIINKNGSDAAIDIV